MMSEQEKSKEKIDFTLSLNVKCSREIFRICDGSASYHWYIRILVTFISMKHSLCICVCASIAAGIVAVIVKSIPKFSSCFFFFFCFPFYINHHCYSEHQTQNICRHEFALSYTYISGGCCCCLFFFVSLVLLLLFIKPHWANKRCLSTLFVR